MVDNRGKHDNRPFKTPELVKDTAREHIRSFSTVPSQYCRANCTKDFLENDIKSIASMYRLYEIHAQEHNYEHKVSAQVYEQIFNTEFNINFFHPKKDR